MEDDDYTASGLLDRGIDLQVAPVEWGPGKTPRGRARPLASRSRTKPQRSCNLCRQRKLRCDRQNPCGNCARRDIGASCTYPTATTATVRRQVSSVHARVQQLEKVLLDMVHGHHEKKPSPQGRDPCHEHHENSTPEALPSHVRLSIEEAADVDVASPPDSDCGTLHHTPSGTSYVSSTHWAAILDDIALLKIHLDEPTDAAVLPPVSSEPDTMHGGPLLLYGFTEVATKEELLASIPERSVVDQLVSGYFSSFEMSPAFIHSHQFLQQYEEFWKDPQAASVIWLGRMFAIMCLATQFQRYKLDINAVTSGTLSGMLLAEQDRQLQRAAENLRTQVVQCLVLANYIRGGPDVVETLMLYFSTELFFHQDAEVGVWVLLGTIVQLAMRMGYHRDPRHFPALSPFAREMQRRVWATIVESDIALAMQMGLPRIIHPDQTDTAEPLNLEDGDFGPSVTEMPPSRPEMDQTPMLFRLVKSRLFNVVGLIWDQSLGNRPPTYAHVTELDRQLQHAYTSIPACFTWRSKTQCMADSPRAVMQKVALQIIYNVALIILRRKYFRATALIPSDQRQLAQKECLDASLRLLDFQHIIHEKMEPSGQLYHERWKVYSLVNHIFLLAASILCFYLQRGRVDETEGTDVDTSINETIRASLRRSHKIWLHSSHISQDAQKGADALSIVLGTEQDPDDTHVETGASTATVPAFSPSVAGNGVFMNSYRPPMNDQAEICAPFSAPSTTTWDNWSEWGWCKLVP